MRPWPLALVTLAWLGPQTLRAEAASGFRGVWAGERMLCAAPGSRLHVYRHRQLRHPVVYEDDTGYACRITRIDGRGPAWSLGLDCTTFGIGRRPRRVRATQTITLTDGGRRFAVKMRVHPDNAGWFEAFLRCPPRRRR